MAAARFRTRLTVMLCHRPRPDGVGTFASFRAFARAALFECSCHCNGTSSWRERSRPNAPMRELASLSDLTVADACHDLVSRVRVRAQRVSCDFRELAFGRAADRVAIFVTLLPSMPVGGRYTNGCRIAVTAARRRGQGNIRSYLSLQIKYTMLEIHT